MFDIIKTFILGILVDKRYRFIFIFIAISLIYRFFLWSVVVVRYELSPVYFVGVNKNGSLQFRFGRNHQDIYTNDYELPSNGFFSGQCEKDYYNMVYTQSVNSLIRSANHKEFMIKFASKFPRNIGKIYYEFSGNKEVREVFETLFNNGIIFKKEKNKKPDYCIQLRQRHLYKE